MGPMIHADEGRSLLLNFFCLCIGLIVGAAIRWHRQRSQTKQQIVNPRLSRSARAALELEKLKEEKQRANTLTQDITKSHSSGKDGNQIEDEDNEKETEWSTEEEEEEEEEESVEGDSEFERMEAMRLKMVLLVRRDARRLSAHDTAVFSADAAAGVVEYILTHNNNGDHTWREWYLWWNRIGCAKIALKCPDEAVMRRLVADAEKKALPFYAAPRGVSGGDDFAVVAIGPAPASVLDPITGSLKLLS